MKKIFLSLLLFIFFTAFVNAEYSTELRSAYTRAYNNRITTQSTIDKANMNGEITRIELSKMISNYAINILKKKPDTSKNCNFSDISDQLDKQYDNGVTNACQLGLMGQGITKFRPYDKVTRAEFGTILSRALYGETFKSKTLYYSRHITALNALGIMNKINNVENINEIRGYVMLMLMRGLEFKDYKLPVATTTKNNIDEQINQTGNLLLYRNEVYGFEVLLGKKWKNCRIRHRGQRWADFFNDSFEFMIPMNTKRKLTEWDDDCVKQGRGNCVGHVAAHVNISTIEAIDKLEDKGLFLTESHNNITTEIRNRNNNIYRFNIWNETYGELAHSLYDDLICHKEMTDGIQTEPHEMRVCPDYFDEAFMNNFEYFNL